ncbi:MAG: hypothetical protein WC325_03845 [Candidatus Bathyarchaeia archaeon]
MASFRLQSIIIKVAQRANGKIIHEANSGIAGVSVGSVWGFGSVKKGPKEALAKRLVLLFDKKVKLG